MPQPGQWTQWAGNLGGSKSLIHSPDVQPGEPEKAGIWGEGGLIKRSKHGMAIGEANQADDISYTLKGGGGGSTDQMLVRRG